MKRNGKSVRRGFALTASIFGGALAVGAGVALLYSGSPAGTAASLASAAASTAQVSPSSLANVCVRGFSKDFCNGSLIPGTITSGSCTAGGSACKTWVVSNARLDTTVDSNFQLCASNGRCDEAPGKNGDLRAEITYTLRAQDPCPYRGYYEGKWELIAVDGTVYQGTVTGTIGAGSHRETACGAGADNCERCVDTEFTGVWRLGTEATFKGERIGGPLGIRDEIVFSMAGDFISPATASGGLNVNSGWVFVGNGDGVYVSCP
ncbi:MAG: hypothetical protein AAGI53_15915 [Planctomycetota bacterium]